MASPSRLRLFYLLHLSKPASDRLVYCEIRRLKARQIVELGLGTGQRSVRMIELLREFHEARHIHYTGIDLFEARTAADGPGISLREAHRKLQATGARIQLVPGTADEALSRTANGISRVDALVISASIPPERLLRAWFFLPRMIHSATRVLQESCSGGTTTMRLLEPREVEQWAARGQRRAA